MNKFGRKYFVFLIIFLGALSAFGPFVTDMYLPTLPSLAEVFHSTPSLVQMGLSMSMLGLAVGQIFFGPISDKYGRRSVLIVSMILFAVSTLMCIFSPDIHVFNLCRFLQGLGGSGGLVLSRSVATDCYLGRELAKMLAIIGAVNGIAPVCAPVVGGLVSEAVGWQGIFWILFGIGVALFLMCLVFKESLPIEKRYSGKVISLLNGFPKLLRLKFFVVYTILYAFANGILFSYISSASFIIQNEFGYSELMFAVFFAVNSVGIGLGSAISLRFRKMIYATIAGAAMIAVSIAIQWMFLAIGPFFWAYEILTIIMLVGLGLIFTSATTMAMDEGRVMTGMASAIFGACGFLAGSIVSPLVGIGSIMTTTLTLLSICVVGVAIFTYISYKGREGLDYI